jgi:hypothetical protein
MDDRKTLKKKFGQVRAGLKRVPNVNVKTAPLRSDYVQALLSRGDRRVAGILARHHRNGGSWPKTLKAAAPPTDFFATRQRPLAEKLPWDFIDHGIRRSFLEREYRRAIAGRPSQPCPVKACRSCGICRRDTDR